MRQSGGIGKSGDLVATAWNSGSGTWRTRYTLAAPGDGGEQQALGDEHADQADPRRAERQADRDLAAAGGGARKQQGRDVGAGDQQHQIEGAEEEAEQHEVAAGERQVELLHPGAVGRDDGGAAAGMLGVLLAREDVELGLRLRAREARGEAAGQREPQELLLLEDVAAGVEVGLRRCRAARRLAGRVQPEVRSGTTPTMVTGRLLTCATRPMTCGSAAKRVRQSVSLMMATGAWPGVRAIAGVEEAAEGRAVEAFDEEEVAGDGHGGRAAGIVVAHQRVEMRISGELAHGVRLPLPRRVLLHRRRGAHEVCSRVSGMMRRKLSGSL